MNKEEVRFRATILEDWDSSSFLYGIFYYFKSFG